jgi:hypothetical protein
VERRTGFFDRLFAAHQWLVFVYTMIIVGVLVWLAGRSASAASAWVAFTVAGSIGVVTALAYTGILLKRGQLFLRDAKAIAQSRSKMQRISIPLGYALGGAMIVVYIVGPPRLEAVVFSFAAGLLLGFVPSLCANYLRLRGEDRA